MTTTGTWIWFLLAVLLALAGIRRLLAWRVRRNRSENSLDDEAIAHILSHGSLATAEDDLLDEEEIARAEQEFWDESWDEPEEDGR